MPRRAKSSAASILARWNAPGWDGFSTWLEDVKPRVRHSNGQYSPIKLEPWQDEILRGALQVDAKGRLQHNLILYVQPRRHAKSTLHALVLLWLATSHQGFTAAALGNHELHGQRVQMRLLRRIIRATPALYKLVGGEKALGKTEIRFPATGGLIVQVTPTKASAFGDQFNTLWVSDWHACPDLDAFNALQASLLDSEDRLTLIDANTGPLGDHVHELELAAADDTTIYVRRVEYRDFDHYCQAAPAWISRAEAKRLQRTTLPAAFERDILGIRGSARNALCKREDIEACRDSYQAPVPATSIPALTGGRAYRVGGGLDRGQSFSFHGDATIWTAVLKYTGDDGEAEYLVLNQQKVPFGQGRAIKKLMVADHQAYRLQNAVIEQYQCVDIIAWAQDARIPVEKVHATGKDQASVFVELARLIQEHRLRFAANLPKLEEELEAFTYELGKRYPTFQAAKGHHDDRVYSLAWAIWALRDEELAAYSLPCIVCHSKSPHARFCYLRGGELQLLCAPDCEAHRRVEAMFLQHTSRRVDDELSLPEFFLTKVKNHGPCVYQGV